jgi:hypothetical protein
VSTNKAEVANQVKSLLNTRKMDENSHQREIEQVKSELEVEELKAAHERDQLKQEYDLKKESIADESQLQMLKLKAVKEIHDWGNIQGVTLNSTDNKEPIYGIIEKFIAITTAKK